ncbi:MAG: leucyl aminopeptidase [Kangiellaceae bacterium]|nr:leucyl aminopeptidase [Kangiellaceae bacterium]|tara:strand:- start:867 stop:2372 length:1506 start_codon:yes stop_codon:yes gene_type:complete
MEFNVKSGSPEKQRTACVVVGVYEPRRMSPMAEHLDRISGGFISNIIRRGDLEGKVGQTLLLHNIPNTLCDRVLLVGCGRERELDDKQYRSIIANSIHMLNDTGSMEAVSYLTELSVRGREIPWKVRHAVEAANECLYRFDQLKSKKDPLRRPLRKLTLDVKSRRDLPDGEQAVLEGLAIASGQAFCKDLGNLPGNICNPTYLAQQAEELAAHHDSLHCEVFDESELDEMGMGAFMSVSRGSDQPGKMIILKYNGGEESQKPIVFVGKGITFDTGGISLKPGEAMDEMKFDMCGAASVMGTMKTLAELEVPYNVIGVVISAENMPSAHATRPGDVVTSLSGQTIEILNTDAEGRLVLCDALTYVERFDPDVVIDIATLTGACIIALGHHISGLISNHNPLAHDLLNAGEESVDRSWRLPMADEYQKQLDSNFADIANIGGRPAGTITAGCFLSRFTKKYHWAHLDIAGVAWKSGKDKGATGRPVPLLSQYVLDRIKHQESD